MPMLFYQVSIKATPCRKHSRQGFSGTLPPVALRHEAADVMRLQLLQRRLVREAEQYIEVSTIAFAGQGGQAALLREVSDIGGSHPPIIIVRHAFHIHSLLLSADVAAFLHTLAAQSHLLKLV